MNALHRRRPVSASLLRELAEAVEGTYPYHCPVLLLSIKSFETFWVWLKMS
jgi:hypothetical protein